LQSVFPEQSSFNYRLNMLFFPLELNSEQLLQVAKEAEYKVAPFAKRLGRSLRQLQREFRPFNITPCQWLKSARREFARRLLKEGKRPSEVCHMVGLTHPHFSRQFKYKNGMSPRQFAAA
jgi:AraC-like DNA-binding protein